MRKGAGWATCPCHPESPPTSATVTAGPSARIRNGGAGGTLSSLSSEAAMSWKCDSPLASEKSRTYRNSCTTRSLGDAESRAVRRGSGRLGGRVVLVAGWAVPGAGRPVAVVGAPAVGAGGGGGAVGFEAQGPAPAVDDDQVVEGAQRHQVGQRGWAALRAGDQMVDLAHTGGLVAARKGK